MKYLFTFFLSLVLISSYAQFGNTTSLNHPINNGVHDLFDLDNDGDLDIIATEDHNLYTGYKDKILWFENIGGVYPNHPKEINDSLEWVLNVKGGDLDNDGDGDILAFSRMFEKLYWGENDGSGVFTFHIILSNVTSMSQIELMDLDNDSDLDIITLRGSFIGVNENLGSGVFGASSSIGTGSDNFRIRDVDNDNDYDIVCVNNSVGYYENYGNATFQPFQNFLSPAGSADVVDMIDIDGDLDLDLLEITSSDSIRVYENIGGVFTNMIAVDNNVSSFTDVRFIDVDNDLDFDIVSSNSGSNEVYFHENLGGVYAPRVILKSGSRPSSLSIVDIDLDNYDDLVYASSGLNVFLNNGGILTNEYKVGCLMTKTDKIIIIDMDGDTDMDIVTTRPSQSDRFPHISWHENFGAGNFSLKKSIDSVYNLKTSLVADLDGDGLPDLLKSYYNYTPSTYYHLSWKKNLGNGNFGSTQIINNTNGYAYDEIAVADLDGDNDLDILASKNGNSLHLYENLGGGTFAAQQTIASTGIDECEFKDIDGDLDIDIIINSGLGGAGWYENLGTLTFSPLATLYQSTSNINSLNIEVDDLDNDGDNDIVSVGYNPNSLSIAEIWIGLNDGAGNFTAIKIDSTISGNSDVFVVDINSDGLKDLAIVSVNPSRIGWRENLGNANFGPFNMIQGTNNTMPVTYYAYNRIVAGDLDSDGDPDLVCGTDGINGHTLTFENFFSGGLQYNGTVFIDFNQNGIMDGVDYGLNSVPVTIQPNSVTGYANQNGYYFFATDTGTSIVSHSLSNNWILSTDSATYTRTLTGSIPIVSGLDFGYYPSVLQTELEPYLTGGFPRCNSGVNYWISTRNLGTTEPNGKIHLELGANINYLSANITPDSIIGQNIYWHYDSLNYFSVENINLEVQMPSVTFIGDTLISYLTVHELDGGGNSVYQVVDTLEQVLVCAYDPNDKIVDPIGYYEEHFISDNQQLEYLIRFQNTGNDTAIDVMLRDRLDTNLDWNSLQILCSSDSMSHWLEPDGEMVFKFANIMLPDSGANFLGSQGFVKFRISPKSGLDPLTRIYNKCDIYFDLNQAVITNFVFNTIECTSVSIPVITYANNYLSAGVIGNYTYEWYLNDTLIFGATTDALTPFQSGDYYVVVSDSSGCYRVSEVFNFISIPVGLNELIFNKYKIKIYPNPFEDFTTIELSKDLFGYDLTVIDLLGRKIYETRNIQTKKIVINGSNLGKGVFIPILINSSTNEKIYIGKIVVK